MPRQVKMSTRMKRVGKMSVDKKRQYTVVLLVMGLALSIAFTAGYMPFATFYYGGDFTATVGIEGFYLPHAATRQTYYENAGGTDIFEKDVDGELEVALYGKGLIGWGTWLKSGNHLYTVVEPSSPNYHPEMDVLEDGTGGYDKWGQDAYMDTRWYPNLEGYYSMLPDIKMELDNIIHIDEGSEPGDLYSLPAGVPSGDGTDNDGYYFEKFYYAFDLTARLHADIEALGGYFVSVMYDGEQGFMHTAMEMAQFVDIYFALGFRTSAINQSVTNFITDIQNYGAHDIQFYEWDSQGSFSKPLGRTHVHTALDNIPPAVPFTRRSTEIVFNRDYLKTGLDQTGPLPIKDSTHIPQLSDETATYFLFSIDRIGLPGYYYTDTGVLGTAEYYGIFDLEVTFPLMATVEVGYDILTGDPAGYQGNIGGTHVEGGGDDDNGKKYSLGTLGTFDMSFITMPIILIGVVMLILINRR